MSPDDPDYKEPIMKSKSSWIILFIFILTLFLRKAGVGMNSILIISATAILLFFILSKPFFFNKMYERVFAVMFLIICLAILQSWLQNIHFNIVVVKNISSNQIILISWIIFSVFIYRSIFNNGLTITFWAMISFILITSVIFNPREFHNFYRSTTYEEYIRSRYPEQSGRVADLFIDKYKIIEKEKSENIFKEAVASESIGDYENALELYNKCIDLNPDNAIAYYRRGLLKLTRLELSLFIANSAIIDFNRSLRLDSKYTVAYFHRGLAFGYLGLRGESFLDMKKVWAMDSTLSDEKFQRKYGSSKKSFSVPFHP